MTETGHDWWRRARRVAILVDNDSWILPFAEHLGREIEAGGDRAVLCQDAAEIPEGEVAFLLGCMRIVPPEVLARNRKNLVVHESALPHGRGFAPMTWQVLEGRERIPVCLLEAAGAAEAGPVVYRDEIQLDGTELCPQLRALQGAKTVELCLRYLREPVPPAGKAQGPADEAGHYPRRRPQDSALDPERTIAEQFDLLRVVDNERYPAFFHYRGRCYRIRITPCEEGE